jgi:hypothetical protein
VELVLGAPPWGSDDDRSEGAAPPPLDEDGALDDVECV